MDGEFLCEATTGLTKKAVGGGNLLIMGASFETTMRAAELAVAAMNDVEGVILPFPGGIVRSGSKVGSKYKAMLASTNDAYCPTLRGAVKTNLEEDIGCVLEIVIDGLTEECRRRGDAGGSCRDRRSSGQNMARCASGRAIMAASSAPSTFI